MFPKNIFQVENDDMHPYVGKGDIVIYDPMKLGFREEDLFILVRELRDSFNNISKISPNLVGKNVHEIKTIIDANTYRILNSFADSATNYTQETI